MQQVPVSQLMRLCPAAMICQTSLVRDAAESLVVNNLTVLVVQDGDGQVVGVLPEATVIRHLMQTSLRDEVVGHLMSRHVETVRADADLNSVLHLFRSSCHSVVPIVDTDGVFVGLLNRSDVVRHLLTEGSSSVDAGEAAGERRKPHFMQCGNMESRKPQPPSNATDSTAC